MRAVGALGCSDRYVARSGATSSAGGAAFRRQGSTLVTVAITAGYGTAPALSGRSVGQERRDGAAGEPFAAGQEAEVHEEREPDDLGPEPLEQRGGRGCGAAGGEDVVDHEHLLARLHRVEV